uniref:Uncharacterized protein n=1 Tax=Setaria italica TaxID=4555 RepID=K4A2F1_SETIT
MMHATKATAPVQLCSVSTIPCCSMEHLNSERLQPMMRSSFPKTSIRIFIGLKLWYLN